MLTGVKFGKIYIPIKELSFMRLVLTLEAENFLPYSRINKHTIQGMIYSYLQGDDFSGLHAEKGFKFFTFSDLFPSNDFHPGKEKTLLISSPNPKFIRTIYENLKSVQHLYLSNGSFKVSSIKKVQVPLSKEFVTGSPIVLYEDTGRNRYFSFRRGGSLEFFLDRVKENALKKYNAYYDDELYFEGPIFDEVVFNKEVAVRIARGGTEFLIIGSMWYNLRRMRIEKGLKKFFNFIKDCGLGEKNSLGFGFLNPRNNAIEGV